MDRYEQENSGYNGARRRSTKRWTLSKLLVNTYCTARLPPFTYKLPIGRPPTHLKLHVTLQLKDRVSIKSIPANILVRRPEDFS